MFAFHGAADWVLRQVATNGYDLGRSRATGKFGAGFYVTDQGLKTVMYTQLYPRDPKTSRLLRSPSAGQALLGRTLLGRRPHKFDGVLPSRDRFLSNEEEGWGPSALVVNGGGGYNNHREIILYEEDMFLPEFLVRFTDSAEMAKTHREDREVLLAKNLHPEFPGNREISSVWPYYVNAERKREVLARNPTAICSVADAVEEWAEQGSGPTTSFDAESQFLSDLLLEFVAGNVYEASWWGEPWLHPELTSAARRRQDQEQQSSRRDALSNGSWGENENSACCIFRSLPLRFSAIAVTGLALAYEKEIKELPGFRCFAQRGSLNDVWESGQLSMQKLRGLTGLIHDQHHHGRLENNPQWLFPPFRMLQSDPEFLDQAVSPVQFLDVVAVAAKRGLAEEVTTENWCRRNVRRLVAAAKELFKRDFTRLASSQDEIDYRLLQQSGFAGMQRQGRGMLEILEGQETWNSLPVGQRQMYAREFPVEMHMNGPGGFAMQLVSAFQESVARDYCARADGDGKLVRPSFPGMFLALAQFSSKAVRSDPEFVFAVISVAVPVALATEEVRGTAEFVIRLLKDTTAAFENRLASVHTEGKASESEERFEEQLRAAFFAPEQALTWPEAGIYSFQQPGIPESLRGDRAVMLAAASGRVFGARALEYASEGLRRDPNFMFKVIRGVSDNKFMWTRNPVRSILKDYAHPTLLEDTEFLQKVWDFLHEKHGQRGGPDLGGWSFEDPSALEDANYVLSLYRKVEASRKLAKEMEVDPAEGDGVDAADDADVDALTHLFKSGFKGLGKGCCKRRLGPDRGAVEKEKPKKRGSLPPR
eukprot:g15780.t1